MSGIRQLAEALGLSIATVSRALAGYPDVSDETRQRVQAEAARMGYRPNVQGRRLRTGRAEAVGIVLPSPTGHFADPFMDWLLAGIGDRLRRRGLNLVVTACAPGEHEIPTYRRLIDSRVVDGMIVVRTRRNDPRIRFLMERGTPFVAFGSSDGIGGDYPRVDVDGRDAFRRAGALLIGLGHRRIGFISASIRLNYVAHREAGWRDAMEQAGLPVDPRWLAVGDLTEDAGVGAARALLDLEAPPTAILCINDTSAIGAMAVCRERGLVVGRDISLIGYDDIPLARFTTPPLTTMHQPVEEIGDRLVGCLLDRLGGGPGNPGNEMLTAELVLRESHGPAPEGGVRSTINQREVPHDA